MKRTLVLIWIYIIGCQQPKSATETPMASTYTTYVSTITFNTAVSSLQAQITAYNTQLINQQVLIDSLFKITSTHRGWINNLYDRTTTLNDTLNIYKGKSDTLYANPLFAKITQLRPTYYTIDKP